MTEAAHVTHSLDSDPPLPGSNSAGWMGLAADGGTESNPHAHHHAHDHSAAPSEAPQ